VELSLDPSKAASYSSRSQIARVVTENWVAEQVYCPACDCKTLVPTPPGTQVVDFVCRVCKEGFQLKSQSHAFRSKVTDAAYGPMIERIEQCRAPSFMFMHYRPDRWRVRDLFLVPSYFLSPSMIERRKPLALTARRARWVGCNILLSALPGDARIPMVADEIPLASADVRSSWRRFSFFKGANAESRGWMGDVLSCVRELRLESFSLADVYTFEDHLAAMPPLNKNIRPKIRQQLQVLRDHGVLAFGGRGRYRVIASEPGPRGQPPL